MALYSTSHLQLFSSKKFVSTDDLEEFKRKNAVHICILSFTFFSQYDVQYRFILITNFLL